MAILADFLVVELSRQEQALFKGEWMKHFFSPVERMLAYRYMRSRRVEGFISVIAWFSLAGITLGVATLITVMSVMNGFRVELVGPYFGVKWSCCHLRR